ncbi:MAG: hypothetical protein NTX66_01840 [Candidatus Falkowbacteria bacterium]|nr:hypothetical protein [Candidatus Falkowbacteria bacterium]
MKKKLKALLVLLFLTAILILPYLVFAQTSTPPVGNGPLDKLKAVTVGSYQTTDEYTLASLLGQIANAFLSLLAIIFIILIILGGYSWLTAAGSEEKVEKAKNTMTRSIIGLLIILGAWAIWIFIFSSGIVASTLR